MKRLIGLSIFILGFAFVFSYADTGVVTNMVTGVVTDNYQLYKDEIISVSPIELKNELNNSFKTFDELILSGDVNQAKGVLNIMLESIATRITIDSGEQKLDELTKDDMDLIIMPDFCKIMDYNGIASNFCISKSWLDDPEDTDFLSIGFGGFVLLGILVGGYFFLRKWFRIIFDKSNIKVDPMQGVYALADRVGEYTDKGDIENASFYCDEAISNCKLLGTEGAQGYLEKLINIKSALDNVKSGIILDETRKGSFIRKCNLLLGFGKYNEALSVCDRAIELFKDDHYLVLFKSDIYVKVGDYAKALDIYNNYYDNYLDLSSVTKEFYYNKGFFLDNLGRHQEALDMYNQAIIMDNRYIKAYTNKTKILTDLGRYEEALKVCDDGLSVVKDNDKLLYDKGLLLSKLKRLKDAMKTFDEILRVNPLNTKGYIGESDVLLKLGKYEEALNMLDKALSLEPNLVEVIYGKACVYALWGKDNEAVKELELAIVKNPKIKERAKLDPDLKSIIKLF